jgi:hypothetical protein
MTRQHGRKFGHLNMDDTASWRDMAILMERQALVNLADDLLAIRSHRVNFFFSRETGRK